MIVSACSHGLFSDRPQARSIAEPFAYEEYRKKRIQEKLDEERQNRVKLKVCCVENVMCTLNFVFLLNA